MRVVLGGVVIADTRAALWILETSHPPTYYLPVADFRPGARGQRRWARSASGRATRRTSTCSAATRSRPGRARSYPTPTADFAALADHVAVYPGAVDACTVDGEVVRPQPGDFYGGWATDRVVGPFKGEPGTRFW